MGNVINSITAGDSGSVSLSSAYNANEEGDSTGKTTGMASGEVAAIVICSVLACCVLGGFCFLHQRGKKKVIEAGVGDEEDRMSGIAMTPGSAYDMTPIGNGDGNKLVMLGIMRQIPRLRFRSRRRT